MCFSTALLAIAVAVLPGPSPATSQPELPKLSLRHLGTIQLEIEPPTRSPIRSIFDFDMDNVGRIGFLRLWESGASTFVFLAKDGSVRREIPCELLQKEHIDPIIRWLGGDSWGFFITDRNGWDLLGWRIDVDTGKVIQFPNLGCRGSEDIAGDRRGGFVVGSPASREEFESGRSASLVAFDASGKQRWRIEQREYDPTRRMMSLGCVTVLKDGRIAVVDRFNFGIRLFDRNGKQVSVVDSQVYSCLETAIKVAPGGQGGLLFSSYGPRSLWSVPATNLEAANSDGDISSQSDIDSNVLDRIPKYVDLQLTPKQRSGQSFVSRRGARVDNEDRIWVSDGAAFFRLDNKGVVDHTLGEEPSDASIRKLHGAEIDNRGRVYLLNERTGAIHVFDRDGKRMHLCKPSPDDFTDLTSSYYRMSIGPRGETYLSDSQNRYLCFSPVGQCLGFSDLGMGPTTGRPLFHPHTSKRWVLDPHIVYLTDNDGQLLGSIASRADGKPMDRRYNVAVAPDGALAIVAGESLQGKEEALTLNLYANNAEPVKTIPMPVTGRPWRLAYGGRYVSMNTWFDNCPYFLDLENEKWSVLPCPGTDDEPAEWLGGWMPFFVDDGKEVWLFRFKDRRIERYATALN